MQTEESSINYYARPPVRQVLSAKKILRPTSKSIVYMSDTENSIPIINERRRLKSKSNFRTYDMIDESTKRIRQNSLISQKEQVKTDVPKDMKNRELLRQNLFLKEENQKNQLLVQQLMNILEKQKVNQHQYLNLKQKRTFSQNSSQIKKEYSNSIESQQDHTKKSEFQSFHHHKHRLISGQKIISNPNQEQKEMRVLTSNIIKRQQIKPEQNHVTEWDPYYIMQKGLHVKSHEVSSGVKISPHFTDQARLDTAVNEFMIKDNPDFLCSFGLQQNNKEIKNFNIKFQKFPKDVFLGNVSKVKRVMSQYQNHKEKFL